MSAPATKVRPAHAITTARASTRCSAAASASRTAASSAFTGGLSMRSTATSPSMMVVTRSFMLGRRWCP
jgi:hypothetical protein